MDMVTCIDEGVYSGALKRGKRYLILERDDVKRQIKVRGDNGRTRWFPCYCFDMSAGDALALVGIKLHDVIEEASKSAVEVEVELSDGQRRWCFFVTPEILSHLTQTSLDSGRLLMYGAAHMIVVSAISRDVIEQALRYIDSQNKLLDCTRRIASVSD